ncbi:hypothetical protein EWH99_01255 [Sporolactobacillus sp. THM7-7]|nr:hypothetical protein EWH99_01255 [Sporolactobacillus sp. THM7-7]
MDQKKPKKPDVFVTFNGRKHTLEEWTRKETAAEKEELDWKASFPSLEKPSGEKQPSVEKSNRFNLPFPRIGRRRKKRGRSKPSLLHESALAAKLFWLPAAAAIVVGLVIGLSLLMVFTGQNEADGTWTGKSGTALSGNENGAKRLKSTDLNLDVSIIQAGVYTEKQSADRAAADLQSRGIPAVTVEEDQTAVFIGAAGPGAEGRELIGYYKRQGLPVYQKSWEIHPIEQSEILENGRAAAFAVEGKTLIQALLDLSGEAAGGQFSPQTIKRADKLLGSWAPSSQESISQAMKEKMNAFKEQTAAAADQARVLQKKKSDESFASYEKALLEAIVLYRQLITSPS